MLEFFVIVGFIGFAVLSSMEFIPSSTALVIFAALFAVIMIFGKWGSGSGSGSGADGGGGEGGGCFGDSDGGGDGGGD